MYKCNYICDELYIICIYVYMHMITKYKKKHSLRKKSEKADYNI